MYNTKNEKGIFKRIAHIFSLCCRRNTGVYRKAKRFDGTNSSIPEYKKPDNNLEQKKPDNNLEQKKPDNNLEQKKPDNNLDPRNLMVLPEKLWDMKNTKDDFRSIKQENNRFNYIEKKDPKRILLKINNSRKNAFSSNRINKELDDSTNSLMSDSIVSDYSFTVPTLYRDTILLNSDEKSFKKSFLIPYSTEFTNDDIEIKYCTEYKAIKNIILTKKKKNSYTIKIHKHKDKTHLIYLILILIVLIKFI